MLTTDRNKSGFLLNQEFNNNEVIITHSYARKESDFERFTAGTRYSPCWINIQMEKIKNGRRTEMSFEIDKEQLELLIVNLQTINSKLEY